MEDQVWEITHSRPFTRAFIASDVLLRRWGAFEREGIKIVEWAAWSGDEQAERDLELCAA